MALLRRILTSTSRIPFRHIHASPQGAGFWDAPHITLQRTDAFSRPRLLTTLSFSAAHGSSSPSPINPAQGSSAGRGEGGKPQVKFFFFSIVGLFVSVLAFNDVYSVYLACVGDVPKEEDREEGDLWIPSTNLDPKTLLDEEPSGLFYMLAGCPGIGKTTRLCDAARGRGAAIYLDGAANNSFKDIQDTINRTYRRRLLNRWKTLSGLAFWVKRFTGKNLVVIVDHIDKLGDADVLQLVSWAKTQADGRRVIVILVESEQSTRPIFYKDSMARAELVTCYPPSAKETREALSKLISTYPDKYNLNVEECLYLRGTRPIEYVPGRLNTPEEVLVKQFEIKHAGLECQGRNFDDVDFWFKLLVAGSNGMSLVKGKSLVDGGALKVNEHLVSDRGKVLSEPCILEYKEKVYFISGRSRELHAALVISIYSKKLESLSAEIARLQFGQYWTKEKLVKEKKKLEERLAKIKECMSKKTYEAYGPL